MGRYILPLAIAAASIAGPLPAAAQTANKYFGVAYNSGASTATLRVSGNFQVAVDSKNWTTYVLSVNSRENITFSTATTWVAGSSVTINDTLQIGAIKSTGTLSMAGGGVDVSSDTGHFKFTTLHLGDDQSIAAETNFGTIGILSVTVYDGSTDKQFCVFSIHGSNNAVNEITDVGTGCDAADTDTKFCVIADGDGTYSIKNRRGSSVRAAITLLGF